jgi:hypothetical protein
VGHRPFVSPPGPARSVPQLREPAPAQRIPSRGTWPRLRGQADRVQEAPEPEFEAFAGFEAFFDDEQWLNDLEPGFPDLGREVGDRRQARTGETSRRADSPAPRRSQYSGRSAGPRRERVTPQMRRPLVPPPGPARSVPQSREPAPAQRTPSPGTWPRLRSQAGRRREAPEPEFETFAGFEDFFDDEQWLNDLEPGFPDLGREVGDRRQARTGETSRRAHTPAPRRVICKIRDMDREHPPSWIAWLFAMVIPMFVAYPITSQSPPQPVQPNVLQPSGDPFIPDPDLLRALVGELSLQQRVELASGKLSLREVELATDRLSPHDRLGLALDGLSESELYEFMQLFANIQGM